MKPVRYEPGHLSVSPGTCIRHDIHSEPASSPTSNRQCAGSNWDGAKVFRYLLPMPVFTAHANIYCTCQYLLHMLVFTAHANIYCTRQYLLHMPVFTAHANIYCPCQYLLHMLVFTAHANIYCTRQYLLHLPMFTAQANSKKKTCWNSRILADPSWSLV